MRRLIRTAGIALLALAAYLLFWPVPIDPVAWQPPPDAGYAGAYAANDRLSAVQVVSVAPEVGPEHIDVGPDGKLYTAVLSGAVLRMNPDGSAQETVVNTGGRPLGFDFAADGTLVVADAFEGLLAVGPDGAISVLTDAVDGDPIRYADAVVMAADGLAYFTDATRRLPAREWGTFDAALLDILEHSCTGRVLVYDPASHSTETVVDGLCFPNGVALSGDGQWLFIAETGEYRIWKLRSAARGLHAPELATGADPSAQVIVADLPGFPDNLTRSANGRLWTGLTKPRSPAIDGMAAKPWLRALILRLPKSLWPVPPAYGHVIAFDEDGRVVADLQDPDGRIAETSGASEVGGRLYIHSLHAGAFGIIDAPAGGPASAEETGVAQGVH